MDTTKYFSGFVQSLICALSFALIGTLTRMLKDMHFTQVAAFHAYGSFCINFIVLAIIHIVSGDTIPRFFTYEPIAYAYMAAAGFLSSLSIMMSTRAQQSEKTAFIQMITYMRMVFKICNLFGMDTCIFGTVFNLQEILGASVILIFCVAAVLSKK